MAKLPEHPCGLAGPVPGPADVQDRTVQQATRDVRGTGVVEMKKQRSRIMTEIPLHLIPQAVARQVRDWGDAVYRISVKRTHWHHFNVTVRTKPVPKELAARATAVLASSGAEHGTGKHAAGSRRRVCVI